MFNFWFEKIFLKNLIVNSSLKIFFKNISKVESGLKSIKIIIKEVSTTCFNHYEV